MILLGVFGAGLWWRRALDRMRPFLWFATAMGPAGFTAVVCGWMVAEVGRQPYVIYGQLRTADAVSPVGAGPVSLSLLLFLVIYATVFSVGALYILRLVAAGPATEADTTDARGQAPGVALAATADPEEGAHDA